MTDDNFLKQIRSDFCLWLLINHLNAFKLLTVIAHRARRYDGLPDGLKIGYAKIGDWEALKMTRGEYRQALKVLCELNLILIIETNRNRKKATTGTTTEGTLVKILDSRVYDINPQTNNHCHDHRTTTEQPLNNHEQERTRKKEKEKEPTAMQPSAAKAIVVDSLDIKKLVEQLKEHPECKERNIYDISEQSINMFSKYPKERIVMAFEFCLNSHIDKTLGATMMWHLKLREPIKPRGFKMTPEDNKLYAIKTLDKVKHKLRFTIDIYGKFVELANGAMIFPTIGYDNPKFKEEFDEWIYLYSEDDSNKQLNGIANGILENLTCKT